MRPKPSSPPRRTRKLAQPASRPVGRVLRLPPALRLAARQARDKAAVSMQEWLAAAVRQHLATVVSELSAAGLERPKGPTVLARWLFSTDTLAVLRQASDSTGLPAKTLLCLVVARQATPHKRTRKTR